MSPVRGTLGLDVKLMKRHPLNWKGCLEFSLFFLILMLTLRTRTMELSCLLTEKSCKGHLKNRRGWSQYHREHKIGLGIMTGHVM
nr:hypothetical protein Iba_chr07aCG1290 [Ipomoea batatas]